MTLFNNTVLNTGTISVISGACITQKALSIEGDGMLISLKLFHYICISNHFVQHKYILLLLKYQNK